MELVAGKAIIRAPVEGWREVRFFHAGKDRHHYYATTMVGDALIDEGILDGDYVLVCVDFEKSEIRPGKLVVVSTPYGMLVKHIYPTLTGKVRLVAANPDYEDLLLEAEDVQIQGLVVRIERDF